MGGSTLEVISSGTANAVYAPNAIVHRDKPNQPNIIVIICDDFGYGDLDCYGPKMRLPRVYGWDICSQRMPGMLRGAIGAFYKTLRKITRMARLRYNEHVDGHSHNLPSSTTT